MEISEANEKENGFGAGLPSNGLLPVISGVASPDWGPQTGNLYVTMRAGIFQALCFITYHASRHIRIVRLPRYRLLARYFGVVVVVPETVLDVMLDLDFNSAVPDRLSLRVNIGVAFMERALGPRRVTSYHDV